MLILVFILGSKVKLIKCYVLYHSSSIVIEILHAHMHNICSSTSLLATSFLLNSWCPTENTFIMVGDFALKQFNIPFDLLAL